MHGRKAHYEKKPGDYRLKILMQLEEEKRQAEQITGYGKDLEEQTKDNAGMRRRKHAMEVKGNRQRVKKTEEQNQTKRR